MDNTMHLINAPLIRIEGNHAAAETYFFAFHRITPKDGGAPHHLLMGGRYADRLEKRRQEWRLIERNVFFQWTQELPEHPELITRFRLTTHRPDKAGELFAALAAPSD